MRHLLLIACFASLAMPLAAQLVPVGFVDEAMISAGLNQPSAMAFLPDGRIVVTELHTGNIKVVVPQTGAVGLVGNVPNVSGAGTERGMLAIAVDPAWPSRPYLYVYYTHAPSPGFNYISMFTVSGQLAVPASTALTLGSRYDILTDIPDTNAGHDGGALRFGPDGMLYASLGEDDIPCTAQTPGSLLGCIVRLDVSAMPLSGSGPPPKTLLTPAGNPFAGPLPNGPLEFARGLRNPFRFHIDRPTGLLFVADVGESNWEEIDVCTGGENFGWPWLEANAPYATCPGAPPANLVAPIVALPAAGGWHSVITMGRYRNPPGAPYGFGAAYEGDLFFSDFILGAIRRVRFNGTAWVPAPAVPGQPNSSDWGSGFQHIVDADTGPDGAIYYLKLFPAGLRRIRTNAVATGLAMYSGTDQVGNAGTPLLRPLVVRATPGGLPTANIPVTFTIVRGSGSLDSQTVLSDAAGFAQVAFTPGAAFTGEPQIVAAALGTTVTFDVTWRGLAATLNPTSHVLKVTLRHSETSSPFTLALDAVPAAPFATTPYGDILTSVFEAAPTCVALDGLGLIGPPDPSFTTGPAIPTWTQTLANVPPLGGINVIFQAYAVDWVRYPGPDSFVVTNPVKVFFP